MTALPLSPRRAFLIAGAVVAAVTLWRVLVLAFGPPNLSFDEAQYWLWSQTFQFGYYSKPPMVAWGIAATTAVCGDGEGCVKLSSSLFWAGAALALFGAGLRLYGPRVAMWAAIAFITLPAVAFSSMVVTTDPPLLMFWAVALWLLTRALDSDRPLDWLLTGLAVGFGLLSKYAMALFLAGLVLYLLWSPQRRVLLRRPGPYLLLLAAGLVYAPNLIWNASEGFVSYAHTVDNANMEGGPAFSVAKLAEFLGAQFGVMGPLLFGALLYLIVRLRRTAQSDQARLLLALALPVLAMMTVQAFLSRANANWAASAYVSATLLVAAWAVDHVRWLLKASVALHVGLAALLYSHDAVRSLTGLDRSAKTDLMKRIRGWDAIGAQVSALMAAHPGATLMADERKLLATLIYYVRPHPFTAVKWNPSGRIHDHFDQTTDVAAVTGPVILVTEGDGQAIADFFVSRRELAHIRQATAPDHAHEVRVWLLEGFKGYGHERQ